MIFGDMFVKKKIDSKKKMKIEMKKMKIQRKKMKMIYLCIFLCLIKIYFKKSNYASF